jgi:NTE family protein
MSEPRLQGWAMFRAAYRKNDIDPPPGGGRSRRPQVGLVLGAGAARGWAHIGALQELDALGLKPDVVVGSSIGTLVGGCYAAGRLEMLEAFARSLTRRRVFGLLDFSFSGGGLIGGERLRSRLEAELGSLRIEDLPIRFAGVATELGGGHEIWLRRGTLVDAIRASYALPGVFEPVKVEGRWLFDGAIVNPVPVSVARALGAERVIALNVMSENVGRGTAIQDPFGRPETPPPADEPVSDGAGVISRWWRGGNGSARASADPDAASAPGLVTSMVNAFDILQDRIMRSRLAGDPPDALVQLKVGKIGMFEFHRADELISLGRDAVRKAAAEIREHAEAPAMHVAGA